MGILDEAIREHLELKRQHGAGDSELKQLEDEAFGPAERPGDERGAADPLAEAPTEFMASRRRPPRRRRLRREPDDRGPAGAAAASPGDRRRCRRRRAGRPRP